MDYIDISKNDHIAVLTFSDHQGLNILKSEIIRELESGIDSLKTENKIYCLVITGAGNKAFAAGADVSEMNGLNEADIRTYISSGSKLFRKIELLEIPVIAAVNGYAFGGGCELACSCDIRIAADTASFGQPEVTLGIIPGFGGTQRLARLVGVAKAKELIFSGRPVKTKEALEIGLVNKVVPAANLLPEATAMAETIAKKGPIAVKLAKKAINAGFFGNIDASLEYEDELFYECFLSEDRKNAMQSFLEKRPFTDFKNQ